MPHKQSVHDFFLCRYWNPFFFPKLAICLHIWMCKMIHPCWEPQDRSEAESQPTFMTHLQILPLALLPSCWSLGLTSGQEDLSVRSLSNPQFGQGSPAAVKPCEATTTAALMESSCHHASGGTCRAMFTIAQSRLLDALLMSSLKVVALAEHQAWEGNFLRKERYQRYYPASLLAFSFPNFQAECKATYSLIIFPFPAPNM